jgi:hypothetical protein
MHLRYRSLRFALIALISTLCLLSTQQGKPVVQDENAVVLPAEGTLDERPFFASRRHPAIGYDRQATDVVGELSRRVDEGTIRLRFDKTSGYLLSVLEALRIPIESQAIIFSKTSLQSHYISPSNPRAIFISDDVTVGFIRNAPLLEISALDPRQGVVFYAIEQRQAERPQIVRSDSCLSCHESRNTLDVPGMLVRSLGVGDGGQTMPQFGNYVSDHRSPFEERWGGWFITGKTGAARHMGNTTLAADGGTRRDSTSPIPLASLDGKFDLEGYPSHYSDVAAVMVLDHQVRMTNLLTRVGWETRIALDRQATNPQEKAAAERLIEADSRELVDYMLFVDEAPLPGKFESTSGFQMKFDAIGPRDSHGRSLRHLDLGKRLMRYPCSYMVYSRAFDALPDAAKDAVYARLWAILSGKDATRKYSKLSSADRTAIVAILMETKPGLPPYFRTLTR